MRCGILVLIIGLLICPSVQATGHSVDQAPATTATKIYVPEKECAWQGPCQTKLTCWEPFIQSEEVYRESDQRDTIGNHLYSRAVDRVLKWKRCDP